MKNIRKAYQLKYVMCLIISLSLVGCANDSDFIAENQSAEQLYVMAITALKNERYERSATIFDEIDRLYPYSKWATKAQLMAGYAHYKNMKYPKAVAAFETYIQLHPGNEDTPYAYYMLGLCYYEQIYDVKRDQRMVEYAFDAFIELLQRFPNSKFSRDAKYKIDLIQDHLAGKEMTIGRFYLKNKAYAASINRFRFVVENYHMTSHIPEALHRLVESYLSLGLKDEARAAAAVLGHNYPGSTWYADTYLLLKGVDLRPEETKVDNRSWLKKLLGKQLDG